MGWLGWTEEELNATTLPAIEMAYRGKVKMLQSIFGNGEKDKTKGNVSADELRSFAMTHNAVRKNGSR